MDNAERNVEERKDDAVIKKRKVINNNHDKKKIIIILITIFVLLVFGIIFFLIFTSKDKDTNTADDDIKLQDDLPPEKKENLGYVLCDDNTALLNVRNSITGEIVDGLSCYKEVVIEQELSGTENCSKWYKINYQKHDSAYTGYVCSSYIREKNTDLLLEEKVREVLDKALDYNKQNTTKVFCGNTSDSKKIKFTTLEGQLEGEYLKSEFESLDKLKEYLMSFMSENLIENLKLSDINDPNYYDNYYEIDGNLYCRNYANSGLTSGYTENYDIEITDTSNNKIVVNIAYEYIKDLEKCNIDNILKCSNSDLEYNIGKVVIEKNNDNYVIVEMDFPR